MANIVFFYFAGWWIQQQQPQRRRQQQRWGWICFYFLFFSFEWQTEKPRRTMTQLYNFDSSDTNPYYINKIIYKYYCCRVFFVFNSVFPIRRNIQKCIYLCCDRTLDYIEINCNLKCNYTHHNFYSLYEINSNAIILFAYFNFILHWITQMQIKTELLSILSLLYVLISIYVLNCLDANNIKRVVATAVAGGHQ